MGTYVVGDIHGCYDEWIEFKNRIEAQDPQATFVLVGDIVDRGPKTYEMIQWAMENITVNGKYQMVLGNHEDMKINWWNEYKEELECLLEEKRRIYGEDYQCTIDYRDFGTENYDFISTMSSAGLGDEQVEEIIHFFKSLPLYKELDVNLINGKGIRKRHYIIVHAGLRYDCLTQKETVRINAFREYNKAGNLINHMGRKNREEALWSRNVGGYYLLNKTVVVHGHSPTFLEEAIVSGGVPGKIQFGRNDINVDCGLVFRIGYSNLAAIRLEDLAEFYYYETEYANAEINNTHKSNMLKRRKKEKTEEFDMSLCGLLD